MAAFGFAMDVLGTGVRESPDYRDSSGMWPGGPIESEDFAAFERDGWRFSRESNASWKKGPPGRDLSSVEAGLLAKREDGGLVIIRHRLVIGFQPVADSESMASILSRYVRWEKLPFGEELYEVWLQLPEDELERAMGTELAFLCDKPIVEFVEPVMAFHLKAPEPSSLLEKSVTFVSSLFQRGMRSVVPVVQDSTDQWQWTQIHAPEAWKVNRGSGTVVAVIDDGFFVEDHDQLPHQALLSLAGDGSNAEKPLPGQWHGTYCAALVGSPLDGRLGNGVAPDCTLLLVAVSDVMNSVGFAKALTRCMDERADVITCSLGPNGGTWVDLDVLKKAIDHVQKNGRNGPGTVVVWAVRNKEAAIKKDELESYAPLLCVAPSNKKDERVKSGHGPSLDLVAPGIGVFGLYAKSKKNAGISSESGASFAAPIVAGVAALILSVNPTLKETEVTAIIKGSCENKNPPLTDVGAGRVNAARALAATPAPPP